MNKEISKLVLPNKKINYFTVSILILGFLCGCIFLILLSNDDKTSTINQVTNYFNEIKDGSFNSGLAFKNNLIINYLYIISIWVLFVKRDLGTFLKIPQKGDFKERP